MLNYHLALNHEPWKYYFYFISPQDFTQFFTAVEAGLPKLKTWTSSLMQALQAPQAP